MLPPSLSYMAEKLGQYETNTVKVFPQGDIQEYVEGQIMEFVLPSNCLVDLDSLFVSFAAGIDQASSNVGRLPADIHSLIDRITIKMGSLVIDDGAHGWSVFKRKYDKLTGKTVGALSHPEIVRAALTNTVASISAAPPGLNQQETIIISGTDYVWDSFDKTFLGTCEPRILDTSILPEINIQCHLKRNVCPSGKVVSTVSGFAPNPSAQISTRPTYVIEDPSLKINCISFADSVYDDALSVQMRSGPIVMPFKKLYSYSDMAFSNMIDFNVATNSLDKIHFQPSDQKYKSGHWSVVRESTNNCEVNASTRVLSVGSGSGLLELSEKYVDPSYASSYVGKRDASSTYNVTYQTSINNTLNPQFKAGVTETYEITRSAVSEDMVPGHMQLFAEWFNDHCHGVVRFNRPGSTVRTPSGLNTQNSSAHMTLIADNIPQECQMDVFVETTAMLYAFAGQAVSLQN